MYDNSLSVFKDKFFYLLKNIFLLECGDVNSSNSINESTIFNKNFFNLKLFCLWLFHCHSFQMRMQVINITEMVWTVDTEEC